MAGIHAFTAGNATFLYPAFHILDVQYTYGAQVYTRTAADAFQQVNPDAHNILSLEQTTIFESVNQTFHLAFQVPFQHLRLADPLGEKYLYNLRAGAGQAYHFFSYV